jgi:magnesium transporter
MRIILREMAVGVMNGAALAAVMSVAVYLWFHDLRLSLTVALALVINVFVASVAGILAPLALERLGRDPAVSSSIFVTFVTDFMGFLAFLGLAAMILL